MRNFYFSNFCKLPIVVVLTVSILSGCNVLRAFPETRGNENSATVTFRDDGDTNAVTQATPNANAPAANTSNGNAQNINAVCGSDPLGSEKCAVALQEHLKYWKFSVVKTDPNGRRQTFDGERSYNSDKKLVIHVNIGGAGRDNDGEWWYRFGNSPLDSSSDRGQRVYLKQNGAWREMRSPPDVMGELILSSTAIAGMDILLLNPVRDTETINGQSCNRYRHVSDDLTTTIWVSRSTGYAVRRLYQERGYTTQTDNSQQSAANIAIASPPPGAE